MRERLNRPRIKPNILLILVDALRPDHLGCYGYPRDTSPNIDKIAHNGILFSNYYSVSSWTNPTIISMFTGLYPQSVLPPAKHLNSLKQVLPEMPTLAKILSSAGYRTVSLNDHPSINRQLNYDQGFHAFKELWHENGWHKDWGGVDPKVFVDELSEELTKSQDASKPFFIFMHILYPHAPYIPPAPYDTYFGETFTSISPLERDRMINVYDGEILYTDQLIGSIYGLLEDRGFLDKTYVIITADHGEGFYEHGMWEHGNTLYNELLNIPLIILPPHGRCHEPQQVSFLTSNIDFFPTILEMARIDPTQYPADGQSLFRFLQTDNNKITVNTVFSESCHSFCVESYAMQNTRYKVIMHKDKAVEVFDKYLDPMELTDISKEMRVGDLKALQNRMVQHNIMNIERRKIYRIKETEMNIEALNKIKSLGYLQ